MQIQVGIDTTRLVKALDRIGQRNVPFGIARGLTDTAKVVKDDAIGHLRQVFHIRTTWLSRGMRVIAADWKKAPWEARVGTKDPFMALQQTGGEKKPLGGSKGTFQGIPEAGPDLGAGMKSPRGLAGEKTTPRGSNWPRQLVAAIRAMEATRAKGKKSRNRAAKNKLVFLEHAKIPTLAIRIANGKGTRGQFRPLWFLYPKAVTIPKRWDFIERGAKLAASVGPDHVKKRIHEAITNG